MDKEFKSVCVMGLGYIGLPTASLLGTKGYQVTGVDVSPSVVETINQGKIHIVEPDLDLLVKSAVNAGNLKASLEPCKADMFIIAVPTPFKDGYVPDLSYVEQATRTIAPFVEKGNLIILESTSPVGTTDLVAEILQEHGHNTAEDVFVAHCPERVLPGRILIELVQNDRIVGGINETSTKVASDFYKEFVSGEVLETSAKTAELSKLTENSFRDVNIAFANELSLICDKEHIDVWELISLANRHPRVNILQPGPGVGGHCIAVDPWFIIHRNPEQSKLIRSAREVNDAKPEWVVNKVKEKAERFKQPVIACLGLTFKANVDDLRESPALAITKQLIEENIGEIIVCEPNIKTHKDFELCSFDEAVDRADILLLLVDHKPFESLSAAKLSEKIVIDTRGIVK
ncbi:UDP-N-acetyl-D-mannosaminuronic acid dehydrogenase [Oleiphilus sp. HI0125]|uniref:UDP-N-acetyl-D-mannosamine dehydrogenase n=2 Tax=Oleiphilus sp. HI0125 TaxID=1822266 RepID=UPI0007C2220E|nr:UDP-N-acetyl-D-mannosamine dehydrogenase [Oleiphilus sp. HI0125]KZZ60964.1 UDP-N-acetyl-D-mannosaminuronic acid dehydrogenase [Oleiphilus sp. HI0125]